MSATRGRTARSSARYGRGGAIRRPRPLDMPWEPPKAVPPPRPVPAPANDNYPPRWPPVPPSPPLRWWRYVRLPYWALIPLAWEIGKEAQRWWIRHTDTKYFPRPGRWNRVGGVCLRPSGYDGGVYQYNNYTSPSFNYCITGQAVIAGGVVPGTPVPANVNSVGWWYYNGDDKPVARLAGHSVYERAPPLPSPAGNQRPVPIDLPQPWQPPAPHWAWQLEPWRYAPIDRYIPKSLAPYVDPIPGVREFIEPATKPPHNDDQKKKGGLPPYGRRLLLPRYIIDVSPDDDVQPEPSPDPSGDPDFHSDVTPRQGERERKVRRRQNAISRFVGGVTEAMDTVQAIYDALPLKLRQRLWVQNGGFMSPWDKARAIYDNYEQLDMRAIVENIALNHLEDFAIGKSSKFATDHYLDAADQIGLDRAVGPMTGPVL